MESQDTLELRRLGGMRMRPLVRALGLHRALALLEARGGTVVKLPVHGCGGPIADIIGDDGVAALRREFGITSSADREIELRKKFPNLSEIELPKMDKLILELRNKLIRDDFAKGVSMARLAVMHRLTRRQIFNIIHGKFGSAGPEPESDSAEQQGDLFAGIG